MRRRSCVLHVFFAWASSTYIHAHARQIGLSGISGFRISFLGKVSAMDPAVYGSCAWRSLTEPDVDNPLSQGIGRNDILTGLCLAMNGSATSARTSLVGIQAGERACFGRARAASSKLINPHDVLSRRSSCNDMPVVHVVHASDGWIRSSSRTRRLVVQSRVIAASLREFGVA